MFLRYLRVNILTISRIYNSRDDEKCDEISNDSAVDIINYERINFLQSLNLKSMHFSYYSIVTSAVTQWNSMEKCI